MYGAYKHVKLTEEQHKKLVDELGEAKTADYIRKVDEYCQQHGKSYKDYNLTIRNWARRDIEQNGSITGNNSNAGQGDVDKYSTVF
ncbi:MAG: hypothetical protein J1E40_05075 [Oscillospiraceae bacterium]|nr:hypothetical protein [Oscillospiraceae bacterium]